MDGLFSGLSSMGLGNLEGADLFEDAEKKKKEAAKKEDPVLMEQDIIYDKAFTCPACDREFTSKIMKTGKAKLLGQDRDLRARYEGVDAQKYEVVLCPHCGYAALNRYFPHLSFAQSKLIKEQISSKVKLHKYTGNIYTYEEALERFKLALASAVVKRAKNSEKAFICLKNAWLLRGYREAMEKSPEPDSEKMEAAKAAELLNIQNAYKGFTEALKSEGFPMCGMDEMTINYLLTVLAMQSGDYENASRMVALILGSSQASTRIKDKARDLKEEILAELKKKKQ